ncbi:MAG: hypothetical protein KDE47_31425, partial [Caldilineaceae bacterium]|nr:hypothetical protein [Caldilineaceae bacterium]
AEQRQQLLRVIATHSPIAWAHINMLGEYDFSDEKLRDNFGILPPKIAPGFLASNREVTNGQFIH